MALLVAWFLALGLPPGSSPRVQAQWFGEETTAAEEDEDNPFAAGLIATFVGRDGVRHMRLVDGLSQAWGEESPDPRVPPGPFSVTFSGRLWVQTPGVYQLRVYAAGNVRLELNGELLLEASQTSPGWMTAKPIELPFGFHPLQVDYRRSGEAGQISLFWQGPQFQLEPVASRWLLHEREQTPSADFERGEMLVRGLRCGGCHELPGEAQPLAAPALSSLSKNLSRDWLIAWLANTETKSGDRANRRMPHFAFTRQQATAIADTLLDASEPLAEPRKLAVRPARKETSKKDKKKKEPDPPPPSAELGASIFRSIGCLACHRTGELGSDSLFGGGDLSHIASKRPAEFFRAWLTESGRLNRDHRMPEFPLDSDQVASLSLYLETLTAAGATQQVASTQPAASSPVGVELIRQAGCANCHSMPKTLASPTAGASVPSIKKTPLSTADLARGENSCLGEADHSNHRLGYRLSEDYRRAIGVYLGAVKPSSVPAPQSGERLLVERNCLACHARGWTPGLSGHLPAIAEADASLAEILPALQPPALHGIGDKLQDEALAASLDAPVPPRRPWLRVRMPKFGLSPPETAAIVAHFIAVDRIPTLPPDADAEDTQLTTAAMDAAGPRLVTADGFGCTSCHAIGKWEPQKVALNAHGTALSQIGSRVRREWFDRWVRNPARIVPQMEMPSVQQPVRGVLQGHLDDQLSAVWRVLNRHDFTPPNPSALRVVRRSNLPDTPEPAAVLTDVIEVDGRGFIKPLVIGLENRHSVLFDLATSRLAAWWIGDVGRQQTRGKTWFWEAGMPQLLPVENSEDIASDLALLLGEKPLAPQKSGQFTTEFDSLEHTPDGLRLAHRLHFDIRGTPTVIRLVQVFAPLPADASGRSGFRRAVTIENTPPGASWQLLALPTQGSIDPSDRVVELSGRRGAVKVSLPDSAAANQRFQPTERGPVVNFSAHNEPATCTLEYRSEAAADQFPPLPAVDRTLEKQNLAVVPGFDAIQLPITDEIMPTGLAWQSDGTLIISSLEGRVWLGRDTDSDGLEDQMRPIGEDLAAPYGVEAAGDAIDVINKYGVLRLQDEDGDGQFERTETIASGWGHTRDYHDWAVGLPRDEAGNYYAAIPCQQDDRSPAAAKLRGRAIKLMPRQPTPEDPHRFAIEEICAGLRFPQGIALSPSGELFATDNQGNYNPYNELNHLVPGARYGFINKLENKPGFNPPARPAAVEIPHPWTRSVNGLCFLSPSAVNDTAKEFSFGPFDGQIIGCEYDSRRLVRMSLEKIAGEYQGAVYPFSREPLPGEPTFEGPLSCRVSPGGDLYVGNIRDSGWGAGSNTGSIVRLRWSGKPAAGIAQVRLQPQGFRIDFTTTVDATEAANPSCYSVVSSRRISTPAYGGDDVDRRPERISQVQLSEDSRSVLLTLGELREGFVYGFHLRNLSGGETFFPAEAYYTLRHRLPD